MGIRRSSYAKIHLFSVGEETKFYTPGSKAAPFALKGCSISPFVCYDLRFPYLFWNQAALTEIFVVIANWPASREEHWRALLRCRAIENQCFVVGVNRVGRDPFHEYGGGSLVVDPWGAIIADAGRSEGITTAIIDPKLVVQTREKFLFSLDRKTPAEQNSF